MDLIVLAKAPVPGRAKTRLCPPCTPVQAASIAEAALADTLDAAVHSGADRVIVALDGTPGPWLPPGTFVVSQGEGTLDRRLAWAWSHAAGPALQIGMDTPQVGADDLAAACATLGGSGVDAALGLAEDGGWWAVGMRRPDPDVFRGVPTSRPDTGRRQQARLEERGWVTVALAVRRDVDTYDDAVVVASEVPGSRFAEAVATTVGRLGVDAEVAGGAR